MAFSLLIVFIKVGQCIAFLCGSAKGHFATLKDSLKKKFFWIALDLLFYFLLFTIILAHAFQVNSQDDFSDYHVSEIPAFSAKFIGALGYQKTAGSFFLLLVAIKFFKYLSFFPTLGFMNSTIANLASEASTFVVLVCIILTCFSSAAVYFFGDSLKDLVSLPRAMVRVFELSVAMTDYSDMQVVDSSFGLFAPVFYFLTMGLLFFLVLNMALAIIVSSFAGRL